MSFKEKFPGVGRAVQAASCIACPLRASDVRRYVRPEISTGRCNAVRDVSFDPDRTIMGEGVQSSHFWVVRSGLVRVQRFGMDGRRQILSLILPGEMVGLDLRDRNRLSVATAAESMLCQIDMRLYHERMETEPEWRRIVYLQQRNQLERMRWLIWTLGVLKPEERFSAFLAVSTRFMPYQPMPDGSGILTMQLRRSDIADLLGTTVESVSRISHRLNNAGLVTIEDPRHFRIPDLKRLAQHGCVEESFRSLPFGTSYMFPKRAAFLPADEQEGNPVLNCHLWPRSAPDAGSGFEVISGK